MWKGLAKIIGKAIRHSFALFQYTIELILIISAIFVIILSKNPLSGPNSQLWAAIVGFTAALVPALIIMLERLKISHENIRQSEGKRYMNLLPRRYITLHGECLSAMVNDIIDLSKKSKESSILISFIAVDPEEVRGIISCLRERCTQGDRIGKLQLIIYHMDPEILEGWPEVLTPTPLGFREQAGTMRRTLTSIKSMAYNTSIFHPKPQFVRFRHKPMSYALMIGEDVIYHGFNKWDRQSAKFQGSDQPCYRIDRTQANFDDINRWLLQRCAVYKEWEELDELSCLGFIGSRHDRREITNIIANLPESTRTVRMLAFSAIYNFLEDEAFKRLEYLMKEKNLKAEFILMETNSPFVNARVIEHPRYTVEALRGRVAESAEQISKMLASLKNSSESGISVNKSLLHYDKWATWRMLFVEDNDKDKGAKVYVSFYPIDKEGHYARVWIFKADVEGRSMFWPLLKQYLDCKYYAECLKDTHLTIGGEKIKTQLEEAIEKITKGAQEEMNKVREFLHKQQGLQEPQHDKIPYVEDHTLL